MNLHVLFSRSRLSRSFGRKCFFVNRPFDSFFEDRQVEAEWASAMLTVGICRAASVESFEGCLRDLGQEDRVVPRKESE